MSESNALPSILFEFRRFYTRNLQTIQPLSGPTRSLHFHYPFTGNFTDTLPSDPVMGSILSVP